MFLINSGAGGVVILGDAADNVCWPGSEPLSANEGIILEYFNGAWYCMEHKRLV